MTTELEYALNLNETQIYLNEIKNAECNDSQTFMVLSLDTLDDAKIDGEKIASMSIYVFSKLSLN